MKNEAKNFSLSQLTTYSECQEAIEAIEGEPMNIVGGLRAWNSGDETQLKAGAKNKVAAIEAKCERLDCTDDDGDMLPNLSAACLAFNEIEA